MQKKTIVSLLVFFTLAANSYSQDHLFSFGIGKLNILSPSHYENTYLDGYTVESSYMLQTSKYNQMGMIGSFSTHQGQYPNPTMQSMQLRSFGLLNKLFWPSESIPSLISGVTFTPYILTELSAIHRNQKNVVIINSGPNYSRPDIKSTNTKIAYSAGIDFDIENDVKFFAEYGRAIYYFEEANRSHSKWMLGLRFTLSDFE